MKKIILLLAIGLMCFSAHSQIAVKLIGTDSASGLPQRVYVSSLLIDADFKIVTVTYRLQLLSPNGVVVSNSENFTYTRFNDSSCNPADNEFNNLAGGALGQGITAAIVQTISVLNTINDLYKLQQTCPQ